MPLPADATEFVDAPTIECDALGCCVVFKLVLLGDHCVKSSSTISVSLASEKPAVKRKNEKKNGRKKNSKKEKSLVNVNHARIRLFTFVLSKIIFNGKTKQKWQNCT